MNIGFVRLKTVAHFFSHYFVLFATRSLLLVRSSDHASMQNVSMRLKGTLKMQKMRSSRR